MTEEKAKKAVLYVFSGTGNTQKIADLYADALRGGGVSVTVHKITADFSDLPDPAGFDYMGIGYPIHAFNAPEIVTDFVKSLPYFNFPESLIPAQRKEYFVFKTSGEPLKLNNASSNKLVYVLKKKGYRLTNEYHYAMPYNMVFRHGGDIVRKMWEAAKKLCPVDVAEILSGEKSLLKKPFLGKPLAYLFRIEQFAMRVNGRFFGVDRAKCTNCGKCVKNCPTSNIRMTDDGLCFGWKCVMCARCSFYCPQNAISIALLNGWKVNGAYDFKAAGDCAAEGLKNNTANGCEENGLKKNTADGRAAEGFSAGYSFDGCTDDPSDPHADFCKEAYEKYFARAQEKIAAAKDKMKIAAKTEHTAQNEQSEFDGCPDCFQSSNFSK